MKINCLTNTAAFRVRGPCICLASEPLIKVSYGGEPRINLNNRFFKRFLPVIKRNSINGLSFTSLRQPKKLYLLNTNENVVLVPVNVYLTNDSESLT